jgi:nucleoside-diphosphate-sugar epimerase
MRIFLTGASGFIGSAITKELLLAGHQVLGLARSDESAKKIAAAGAEVHRGSLDDLESLQRGAAASDGVIHTAFIHDFSKFKDNCETDRAAIEAIGAALAGTARPLVITSGTALFQLGRPATEADAPRVGSDTIPRVASEEAAKAMAEKGVHVSVVRLPPTVHGQGDKGFVPMLIGLARQKGVSAYVGEGRNRWSAVHRLDAARLYVLAAQKAAKHAIYHGVGEEGVATRAIAETIGRHLHLPVVSKTGTEVADHFGWLGTFFSYDVPASSVATQEQLGWIAKQPGLIADLDQGHYF